MPAETLSAIIIGNEVLSAKVVDLNGPHLLRRCRERGVRVCSVAVVPDEVDAIVEQLHLARKRSRFVVTSGGVGPTHDDVTVRAVALALGRDVVRLDALERILAAAWAGKTPPPEALRMAEGPRGAELLSSDDTRFPVLSCDGVFLLPGVPELFRNQLEVVLPRVPGAPVAMRVLYLRAHESDIARPLDAVALERPEVAIGSYPTFDRTLDYWVKVTIEHEDPVVVESTAVQLKGTLPAGVLVREEASADLSARLA